MSISTWTTNGIADPYSMSVALEAGNVRLLSVSTLAENGIADPYSISAALEAGSVRLLPNLQYKLNVLSVNTPPYSGARGVGIRPQSRTGGAAKGSK